MKTSWSEAALLDKYLTGTLSQGDKLVLEARLLLYPRLRWQLRWQKLTYLLLRQYHRKKMKTEVHSVAQELFSSSEHSAFQQKIGEILNP